MTWPSFSTKDAEEDGFCAYEIGEECQPHEMCCTKDLQKAFCRGWEKAKIKSTTSN